MGGDPASKGITPYCIQVANQMEERTLTACLGKLKNWATCRACIGKKPFIHLNVSGDDKIKSCHILNYIYILIISIAIYHAHIVDTENVYIFYVDLALKIT